LAINWLIFEKRFFIQASLASKATKANKVNFVNTVQTLYVRRRRTIAPAGPGHLPEEHGLLPISWPAGPQAVKANHPDNKPKQPHKLEFQ
jgi:hypothetical protein